MANRNDLREWVLAALVELDGSASITDIAKHIWTKHEHDLRASGDLFFTWQYDMRWAAKRLRDEGKIAHPKSSPRGTWALKS